jgi:two-component system sensor histidine kinase DesK
VADPLHESMRAVQEVVAGARDTSLHGEISRALSVLRSAGIEARVAVDDRALRSDVEETLGWVVREGTTNVLRHSSASACSIELSAGADGSIVLTILNDSPSPPGHRWAPSGGQGLLGMRQRLATIGGELTVQSDETSYRMVVSVPEEAGA